MGMGCGSCKSWIFSSILLTGKFLGSRVLLKEVPVAMDRAYTTTMLVQAFKMD
jgi:hypothetical protein